jgi:histidyl-tRNA synthetase
MKISCIGNGNQLNKYYYCGPMFRYERPQAGRYVNIHQFGVEAIGNIFTTLRL